MPDRFSTLNFERHKWGGVRHDDPVDIGFDLDRFIAATLAEDLGGMPVDAGRDVTSATVIPADARFAAVMDSRDPITVAGLQFGALLGGAIITEKIFARPGLGTLLLEGVNERNYPLVQGTVLVIAVSYAVVNLLTDLTYGLVDPRVRRA